MSKSKFCVLAILLIAVLGFSGAAMADGGSWVIPTGVLYYDSDLAYDGYNLITPYTKTPNRFSYLFDNEGRIVHILKTEAESDHCATFTEQGTFLRNQGGAGSRFNSRLNEYDWDSNLIQEYRPADPRDEFYPADGAHHGHWRMPNGNTLQIFYRSYLPTEAAAAGMEVSNWDAYHRPDIIVEFDPDGNIVWEWDTFQHMHAPGETDLAIRYAQVDPLFKPTSTDWQHSNAVNYDPERDWVLLSVTGFDEIWAIDHNPESPTYLDIVWRYGSPMNWDPQGATYPSATVDEHGAIDIDYGDKVFYTMIHDVRWSPVSKNISIYNNSGFPDNPGSIAMAINPDTDEIEFTYPAISGGRGAYTVSEQFLSPRHASAQELPNGNWLIHVADNMLTREVTSDGTIAWEFKSPFVVGQTECWLVDRQNDLWASHKILRYGTDHPGLAGKTFNVNPPQLIAPQCQEVWKLLEADAELRDVPTVTITAGDFVEGAPVDVYVTVTGDGTYDVLAGFEYDGDRYYADSVNTCFNVPDRQRVLQEELVAPAGETVQVFDFVVPVEYGGQVASFTVFAEVTNHGMLDPLVEAEALLTIGGY